MKTCWIHIGMPKTGTTSVQVYLMGKKSQPGWRYVSFGGAPDMNREMHAMFGTAAHKWYWFAKRGESPERIAELGRQYKARLAEAILDAREENILISSEALSLIEKPGIIALREFLLPLCDRIRIVGYVRPPIGFMVSFFQQRVKSGYNTFDVTGTLPQYRFRFEKFDEIFGKDNVLLRKFDPASFPGGCFVADFCRFIGMPGPGEVKRVNESLTREGCGMLFAYYKFGPGYGVGPHVIHENNSLISPMFAMRGNRFGISRELAARGLVEEDIAWIERRLGSSIQDSAADHGGIVSSESELLRIPRAALADYVECFQRRHGIEVASDWIPAEDYPDPVSIAGLLEKCRGLIQVRMEGHAEPEIPKTGKICWLHASMHHAGAHVIQRALSASSVRDGWTYVTMNGGSDLNQEILDMFGEPPVDGADGAWFERREALRRRFADVIRSCGGGKLIISAESFTLLERSGLEELKGILAPLVDEIRVVGFARSPEAFKIAILQQNLRNGKAWFDISSVQPRHRKRFKKFDNVFGRDQVTLRLSEAGTSDAVELLEEFQEVLGIRIPISENVQRMGGLLCREATGILHAYRKFGPGYAADEDFATENRRVMAPLLAMNGRRLELAASLVSQELDNHDISWAERRFGVSFQRSADPPSAIATEEDLLDINGAACAEMALRFREVHGLAVPRKMIPSGDRIDPRQVASFVEYCRGLSRKAVELRRRRRRLSNLISSPLSMALRWAGWSSKDSRRATGGK